MTLDPIWNSEQTPVEIQELAIALYARELDPQIAQPDFLKFSGIIPTDWGLKNPPILRENLAQLIFENGVTLVAQPRTVSFSEAIANNTPPTLQVPGIVRRYAEKLPHIDYQALSINPKTLVVFPDKPDAARNFTLKTLLAPGSWRDFASGPQRATVNLVYQLDRAQLQVNIDEVRVQQSDRALIPALLFSGSFNYAISGETAEIKQNEIHQWLDNWATDLDTFRHLVRKQFLGGSDSLFPPEVM